MEGGCQGGLREGVCTSKTCTGGPDDGNVCAKDSDCPGDACSTDADCGGGMLHVYAEAVVPGAGYSVQVIGEQCNLDDEQDYSEPVILNTAVFGDVLTSCDQTPCTPAGDGVHIIDILGIFLRFGTVPGAPSKTRTEWEPSRLDLLPAITDALTGVIAFQGLPYPFLRCSPSQSWCVGGPNAFQSCVDDSECELALCPP